VQVLLSFKDPASLIMGFAGRLIYLHGMDPSVAIPLSESMVVFEPNIYAGGSVIPSYGFSEERIGVHVARHNAGDPFLVEVKP